MLRKMNDRSEDQDNKPYTTIIDSLKTEWDKVLNRTTMLSSSANQPKQRFEDPIKVGQLVDEIFKLFTTSTIRPTAMYPESSRETGWLKAREWRGKLLKNLREGRPALNDIHVTQTSKLHDALNAAWLCRIDDNAPELRRISRAALELCEAIITANSDGGRPSGPSSSSTMGAISPGQTAFVKPQVGGN
jgi:hypothetical protein